MAIFNGTPGNDKIFGTVLADLMSGFDGKDQLYGRGGDDTILGGDNHDRLFGENGNDDLRGGTGNDRLWGGDGDDTAYGEAGKDQIWGGAGNDVLAGGASHDTLYGNSGADTLFGGAGNDQLYAGIDDDFVTGQAGDDTLDGSAGNDTVMGGSGADSITGGSGDDNLQGGADDDRIKAGAGNDTMRGDAGNDILRGNTGDDLLTYDVAANAGALDRYYGDVGHDTLRLMMSRADWLNSDLQADIADFLAFVPTAGIQETFRFSAFNLRTRTIEELEVEVDGVLLTAEDDPVFAENDDFETALNTPVSGNVLDDNGNGPDIVPDLVQEIAMTLQPLNGDLTIDSVTGDFTYEPDPGFVGTDSFVYTVIDADGDMDTATVTIDVAPPASIEGTVLDDLMALGYVDGDGDMITNDGENIFAFDGNDYVEAGGGNDLIEGGAGNDTILGQNGDDTIEGGLGNDSMTGGLGADVFYFNGDIGDDRIADYDIANDILRFNDTLSLSLHNVAEGVLINYGDTLGNFGTLLVESSTLTALEIATGGNIEFV